MGLGQGVYDFAMAGLGIAVLVLLVKNANQTVQVTQGITRSYVDVLNVLTGSSSNPYGVGGYR